jgi:hypothetical protein
MYRDTHFERARPRRIALGLIGFEETRRYPRQERVDPARPKATLASVHRRLATEIGIVVLRCPVTGSDADTGMIMERGTLATIEHLVTRFDCAACGRPHTMRLEGARMAPLCRSGR